MKDLSKRVLTATAAGDPVGLLDAAVPDTAQALAQILSRTGILTARRRNQTAADIEAHQRAGRACTGSATSSFPKGRIRTTYELA